METENPESVIGNIPQDDLDARRRALEELEFRKLSKSFHLSLHRLLFLGGVTLIIIGVFFWLQTTWVSELFIYGDFSEGSRHHKDIAANVRLFGSFFILISTVVFSYLYMAGFKPRRQIDDGGNIGSHRNVGDEDSLVIVSLLRSIDRSLEKGKLESVLSENERGEIITKISETVESQLNDSLLSKIEDKYGVAIYNAKLSSQAELSLNNTISRLKSYAEKLQQKAAVNLGYGIAATIAAICILIFVLFNASPPPDTAQTKVIFYYTSRLFLVFLVQGVSIFFLNLYKATLRDILYMNNEITNHEAKRDALALAFNSGNKEAANALLIFLAKTERNFTIKKGESSIFNTGDSQQAEVQISGSMMKELLSKLVTRAD